MIDLAYGKDRKHLKKNAFKSLIFMFACSWAFFFYSNVDSSEHNPMIFLILWCAVMDKHVKCQTVVTGFESRLYAKLTSRSTGGT